MADIESIYKALRLLPEFDGNVNVLTRFIKLCDQLVANFIRDDENHALCNLALINGILNKVTGPAARLINSNGLPENWDGIRKSLINNFSDQRDETSLYNDLALITQGSGSPQEFYERCQNLFSTIMTYVSLHEDISSTIESKRSLYKKLTLQAYVRGLKDPLGSRIRCMRPDTIEKALEFVHEETNTLYMQQRNENFEKKSGMPHSQAQTSRFLSGHHVGTPAFPPRPFLPARQFEGMSRPLWRPDQFRGPTRTQQMFRAPPPNYRPSSNTFRIPPQSHLQNSPKPQPMSGVSHYVTKPLPMPIRGHDFSRFGNPPPSNYFKSREINSNILYDPYYETHADDTYGYEYSDYPDYAHELNYDQTFNPYWYDVQSPVLIEETNEDAQKSTSEDFRKDPPSEKLK